MQHHLEHQQQQPFAYNTAPGSLSADLARLETSTSQEHQHQRYSSPRSQTRPPRPTTPSSSPSRRHYTEHTPSSNGSHPGEQHVYEPELLSRPIRRSSSDQRIDTRDRDRDREPERDHRPSNPPRPRSLSRRRSSTRSGARSDGRSSTGLKKRSQSLGDRMALAVANPREPPPPSSLMLYHVSKPEPRARWVFNLSKHTNVVDKSPPPDTITSSIDKKRPNLGGLVWINAVQGSLHCCLQKGVKNKAVTPVPTEVLDGWLNGQTGFWWIGALKEGHRALWDSHVVMNWAMVFIPSSPEVAARNNMEVWNDKCLRGSLRVARPGELARKILDIVADDQDKEPEQVVHTHLCILLAEGDDLELKRPKMFSAAPTPRLTAGGSAASPSVRGLSHSKSLGTMDLSQANLDRDGNTRLRSASGDGGSGRGEAPFGGRAAENLAALEEKVGKYRERIVILKEDRRSKKALVEQLRNELVEKEETLSAENERLRLERNDIKDRAKALWEDIENLRRDRATSEAESQAARQDAEGLKKLVDRLRRERNTARSDAMRWLEQQRLSSSPAEDDGGDEANGVFPKTPGSKSRGIGARAGSAPGGLVNGTESTEEGGVGPAKVSVDAKAAAAIAKLKSKVERLRRERDEAEKQAAALRTAEQENLAAGDGGVSSSGGSIAPSTFASTGGGGGLPGGGPVVASLRAEGLKLKRELREAREEADRLRRMSPQGGMNGGGEDAARAADIPKDGEPEAAGAQQALGRLLGQALNLLGPQGAGPATSPQANGGEQHSVSTSTTSLPPSAVPQGYPGATTTVSSGAASAPVAETAEPPPEVLKVAEYELEGTHVPTEPSHKFANTANGTSGGDDETAATGLVGERIRQFAKAAGAIGSADTGTATTTDISASSSPAVDGTGDSSAKTWNAHTEVVEAGARLAEKAE